MKSEIVIIDDDENYIKIFKSYFEGLGVNITVFKNEDEVKRFMNLIKRDMVYIDHSLHWCSGVDLIKDLSKNMSADFSLICSDISEYTNENIINNNISGILYKYCKDTIVNWCNNTINKKKLLQTYT